MRSSSSSSSPSSCLRSATLILASSLLARTAHASPPAAAPRPLEKRLVDQGGYYNPVDAGGSWLTLARNTYPAGLGEPINIVISADSDGLLMTDDGFFDYAESLLYSSEFLGQSLGDKQEANLGDGKGEINQTTLLRYNFGDPVYGTLRESINGGSHFRVWRQNGTSANSGAWFLAASVEMPSSQNHDIVANGYDLGRDEVISWATASNGTKSPLTNRTFTATSRNESYLANTSTSAINHGIATDGTVAILTVRVTSNGSVSTTSSAASPSFALSTSDLTRLSLLAIFSTFALGLLA